MALVLYIISGLFYHLRLASAQISAAGRTRTFECVTLAPLDLGNRESVAWLKPRVSRKELAELEDSYIGLAVVLKLCVYHACIGLDLYRPDSFRRTRREK